MPLLHWLCWLSTYLDLLFLAKYLLKTIPDRICRLDTCRINYVNTQMQAKILYARHNQITSSWLIQDLDTEASSVWARKQAMAHWNGKQLELCILTSTHTGMPVFIQDCLSFVLSGYTLKRISGPWSWTATHLQKCLRFIEKITQDIIKKKFQSEIGSWKWPK